MFVSPLRASRYRVGLLALAVAALAALAPKPAAAWWRGGVVIGLPPVFVGPPVVVAPPPVVYAPPGDPSAAYPPAAYPAAAAPPGYAAGPGRTCAAVAYICPLDAPRPVGSPCSCPTNSGGRAGGLVQ
jgi:hypothetical protein